MFKIRRAPNTALQYVGRNDGKKWPMFKYLKYLWQIGVKPSAISASLEHTLYKNGKKERDR